MSHSAKSLFNMNIQSSEECLRLYGGISTLGPKLEISWLLRASIVFSISAIDAYYHDKIRYRAGQIDLASMPQDFAEFKISVKEISRYDSYIRKGVLQSIWLDEHFSIRPLQKKNDIAKAMKLVGYEDYWASIEPDTPTRNQLLDDLSTYVKRRNQIVHEGDRLQHRSGGKQLRPIDMAYAETCMEFVKNLVVLTEIVFPGKK